MEKNLCSYQTGDHVVYGTNGVCLVEAVKEMSFSRGEAPKPYYVLRQIGRVGSTLFVPLDNELLCSRMRHVLTAAHIDAAIAQAKGKQLEWPEDRRVRTELFRDMTAGGFGSDLILLIDCLKARRRALAAQKKKLSATDGDVLVTALRMLRDEVSFVLGVTPDEAEAYVKNALADH